MDKMPAKLPYPSLISQQNFKNETNSENSTPFVMMNFFSYCNKERLLNRFFERNDVKVYFVFKGKFFSQDAKGEMGILKSSLVDSYETDTPTPTRLPTSAFLPLQKKGNIYVVYMYVCTMYKIKYTAYYKQTL